MPLDTVPSLGPRPQRKPRNSLLDVMQQISIGGGRGLTNNLIGIGQMVAHPIQAAQGLYQAARHPMQTANAMMDYGRESFKSPMGVGQFLGEMLDPLRVGKIGRLGPGISNIVSPEQAMTLRGATKLPDSPEFLDAVKNTPGAEITPDGLKMRIARRQSPEMDDAESVRTGVFYLPAGHKNMKHYTGKTGYGGSEKFEGETLIRNPLFVKGATGGKAPQMAYDSVMGKGAYDKMRDDVLKAQSTGWNKNPGLQEEQITALLEKYGGNPDQAYNIIQNSKAGNTLAYALQENIVAHAVRNAGHDAVLGFSVGRDGARSISEIFDVRETTYPSQFGKPSIHEAFDPE